MSDALGPAVDGGELRYVSPSAVKRFERCARAWAFRYVDRLPEGPPTKAQRLGVEAHSRIEYYLKTGEQVLGELERPMAPWIPAPPARSPLLVVEVLAARGTGAPLVSGVPLVTRVDCLNNTGTYVDPDEEVHAQEEPEVLDWKFSSDPRKWGMTPRRIADDLAMATYGLWAVKYLAKAYPRVRLSHVYSSTKKRDAFKVTSVVPVERLTERLRAVTPMVEEMKGAAGSAPNDLAPNFDACNDYGRVCPFMKHCQRPPGGLVRSIFGDSDYDGGGDDMGLLDALTDSVAPEVASRLAFLEEQEKREAPRNYYADVVRVRGYGYGSPVVAGELAALCGAEKGAALAGSGRLARVTVSTVADLDQLLAELEKRGAAVSPPDAPEQVLSRGADPVEPSLAASLPEPARSRAAEVASGAAEAPKRGRGRPKKEDVQIVAQSGTTTAPAGALVGAPSPGIELWVDCLPVLGDAPQCLDGYVREVCDALAGAWGAPHVLLGGKDTPLAYAGWEGALELAVRERPPAPGRYLILGARGDRVREAVVRGLSGLCSAVHRGVS